MWMVCLCGHMCGGQGTVWWGAVSSCLVWDRSLAHHCIHQVEYTTKRRVCVCGSETPRASLFSTDLTANTFIDQAISQALFYLFYSSNQVSNPQILSHVYPRTAANTARHETVDLLKRSAISLFPFCSFFLCNSMAQFSSEALEMTWCHNVRRLESVIRQISVHMCHVLLIN